jgi:hypothetical protein
MKISVLVEEFKQCICLYYILGVDLIIKFMILLNLCFPREGLTLNPYIY